jgi:hypothetical protein
MTKTPRNVYTRRIYDFKRDSTYDTSTKGELPPRFGGEKPRDLASLVKMLCQATTDLYGGLEGRSDLHTSLFVDRISPKASWRSPHQNLTKLMKMTILKLPDWAS